MVERMWTGDLKANEVKRESLRCSGTVKGRAAQVGGERVAAGRYPAWESLRNQPIARIN